MHRVMASRERLRRNRLRLLPSLPSLRRDVERLARGIRAGRWEHVAREARRLRPVLPFALRSLADGLVDAAEHKDALPAVHSLVLLAGEIDRLARRAA